MAPAGALPLPCQSHALSDHGARLAALALDGDKLLGRQPRHGDMQVDSVQDRAGKVASVPGQSGGRTAALFHRVTCEAAGAGVAGRHHQALGRIDDGADGPADRYVAILERLAQSFYHVARKLGKFVEEEHSARSEADLAWSQVGTASAEGHGAGRVVH